MDELSAASSSTHAICASSIVAHKVFAKMVVLGWGLWLGTIDVYALLFL
jgi:hypothetical protein